MFETHLQHGMNCLIGPLKRVTFLTSLNVCRIRIVYDRLNSLSQILKTQRLVLVLLKIYAFNIKNNYMKFFEIYLSSSPVFFYRPRYYSYFPGEKEICSYIINLRPRLLDVQLFLEVVIILFYQIK